MRIRTRPLVILALAGCLAAFLAGSGDVARAAGKTLAPLPSAAAFDDAVRHTGEGLVIISFTAAWCAPCQVIEPIIVDIAAENPRIKVYAVDVDQNGALVAREGIRGIPYVAFYRQGRRVYELMGMQPEYRYHQAIRQLDHAVAEAADGRLVDGVRVIRHPGAAPLHSIYVYRGETVRLTMAAADTPYAFHIPDLSVEQSTQAGKPLDIRFKAKTVGVYPIYCNGGCPNGDGMQAGRIVVMPYAEAAGDTNYKEVSAETAHQMLASDPPLILDVRTPREFSSGHIPGAVLIPLQQLAERLNELAPYRHRRIFIYCRSGNRSTVAAEILHRAGFKSIVNLRHGIIEWQSAGYPIATPAGS